MIDRVSGEPRLIGVTQPQGITCQSQKETEWGENRKVKQGREYMSLHISDNARDDCEALPRYLPRRFQRLPLQLILVRLYGMER